MASDAVNLTYPLALARTLGVDGEPRRRVTIGVLAVQLGLAFALFAYTFINAPLAESRVAIRIGTVLFGALLGLYLLGWKAATHLAVLAVTLVIGFAMRPPFLEPSLAVMVGP